MISAAIGYGHAQTRTHSHCCALMRRKVRNT